MTRLRQRLVYPAVAGALYAALTMLLAPLSYGALQFRLSEALCVLPFFLPWTAVGLWAGCALANTLSAAGLLDVVFGSLATLLAGLCTAAAGRRWRRGDRRAAPSAVACLRGCMPPVLINGLLVGAVLAWSFARDAFWSGLALLGGQVALGEAAVLLLLGLPLMKLLYRLPPAQLREPPRTAENNDMGGAI